MSNPDLLVIGAGPGGYVAAIRGASLGLKVAVAEMGDVGGVCLNVGCIPSKAIITAAGLAERIRVADRYGIHAGDVSIEMPKLVAWKQGVVDRLTGGVRMLLGKHGVEVIQGRAKLVGPGRVDVETKEGVKKLSPKATILATGSRPIEIPGFTIDEESVLSSTGVLALNAVPKRLLVIGAGYIGLEMGIAYRLLGSEVTVVEVMDSILPGQDKELAGVVARSMKKRKIKTHLESRAMGYAKKKDGSLTVTVAGKDGKEQKIDCDKILLTVGRKPNSDGLGIENVGLTADSKGFIEIDAHCRTKADGIYAIGDLAGEPMLAHKASHEGIVAAEVIAGEKSACDWSCVPAVIFTDPEIATVGLTESQAKAEGIEVVVGKFPFGANGRALTLDHAEGFTKIVAEKESGTILGVHIVGPEAAELISEGALAVEMGASLTDVALTIHPHPTLPETMMEAAEAAMGQAIHIFQGKG